MFPIDYNIAKFLASKHGFEILYVLYFERKHTSTLSNVIFGKINPDDVIHLPSGIRTKRRYYHSMLAYYLRTARKLGLLEKRKTEQRHIPLSLTLKGRKLVKRIIKSDNDMQKLMINIVFGSPQSQQKFTFEELACEGNDNV
tara:strand:- start:4639 stop:5064 length:426 start_codon:yes stop_codon:yes gene_type:complete